VQIGQQNSVDIESFAQWLKIIGEPNRLRIINLLIGGVQCNCEIGDMLGMAPNLISHHLKVLREEGLVNVERDPEDSRWLYYTLNIEKYEVETRASLLHLSNILFSLTVGKNYGPSDEIGSGVLLTDRLRNRLRKNSIIIGKIEIRMMPTTSSSKFS